MAIDMTTLALAQSNPSVFQNATYLTPTAAATATTQPIGQAFNAATAPNTTIGDAEAYVRQYLISLGLGDLTDWAMSELHAGATPDMIALDIRNQPAFRTRFRAIFDREKAGYAPLSPMDIINYEEQARQLMVKAGLPVGFYDQPDDFANFLAKDISLSELSDRVQNAYLAVSQAPQDVRDELNRIYGIDANHLAAWALDESRALPIIERQAQAAMIGGAGTSRGFSLSQTQLENLAAEGVTREQAVSGFTNLNILAPLFSALPGMGTESDISQTTQIAAQFGSDAAAQLEIQRRQAGRKAAFEQGGEYAAGAKGITGLGSAATR